MSDSGEHLNLSDSATGARSGGSGWTPEGDPVEAFGHRIDQALRPLSLELAAIRAERDGLRLELEGIRAQYELLRQQLADRDRFASTVRELSEIVRHLTLPARWAGETELQAPPPQPPQPHFQAPSAPQAAPTVASASWTASPVRSVPPAPTGDRAEVDWSAYLAPSVAAPTAAAAPIPTAPAQPPPAPASPQTAAPEAPPAPEQAPPAPPVAEAPSQAPIAAAASVEATDTKDTKDTTDATVTTSEASLDWASYLAEQSGEGEAATAAPKPPPLRFRSAAAAATTDTAAATKDMPATSTDDPVSSRSRTSSPEHRIEMPFVLEPTRALETGVWEIPVGGTPRRRRRRQSSVKKWATRLGSVLVGLVVVAILVVSVGPKFLPYQTFFVRSGSMEPAIEVGEMIFLTKVHASDLGEGAVITFERPDKPGTFVTHRIVATETSPDGKVFQTKGDANASPDSWRVPANGDGWKVAFGIPKLGYVFGYLGSAQARLALLAIPAVILGVLSLIDIWRPSPKSAARRR